MPSNNNKNSSNHHILYESQTWSSRPELKSLRQRHGLQVRLDNEVHTELHRNIVFVPVPDRYMISRVNRSFEPGKGILATMDNLIYAFDEACKHPRVQDLERGVGELVIHALELQKPYILDGVRVHGTA